MFGDANRYPDGKYTAIYFANNQTLVNDGRQLDPFQAIIVVFLFPIHLDCSGVAL